MRLDNLNAIKFAVTPSFPSALDNAQRTIDFPHALRSPDGEWAAITDT